MKIQEILESVDTELNYAELKESMLSLYQAILHDLSDPLISQSEINSSMEFFEKWILRVETLILNKNVIDINADANFIYQTGCKLVDRLKQMRK